jgi:hypothetical protein
MDKLIPCAHCAPLIESLTLALARDRGVDVDVIALGFGANLHAPVTRPRLADWFAGVRQALTTGGAA